VSDEEDWRPTTAGKELVEATTPGPRSAVGDGPDRERGHERGAQQRCEL
jgi:hypothetical protein